MMTKLEKVLHNYGDSSQITDENVDKMYKDLNEKIEHISPIIGITVSPKKTTTFQLSTSKRAYLVSIIREDKESPILYLIDRSHAIKIVGADNNGITVTISGYLISVENTNSYSFDMSIIGI